jgi:hypothetical protein
MTDQVENPGRTSEPEATGLLTNGAARIAVIVCAVIALAGISAGAWLRLRHS